MYNGSIATVPVMDLIQELKIKLIIAFSMPFHILASKNGIYQLPPDKIENVKSLESIIITGERTEQAFIDKLKSYFPYAIVSDQFGICEATVLTSNLLN